jgi:hypothetical protein
VADFLQLVRSSVKRAHHSTAKELSVGIGRLFQQKEHTISIQWNELHFVLKEALIPLTIIMPSSSTEEIIILKVQETDECNFLLSYA